MSWATLRGLPGGGSAAVSWMALCEKGPLGLRAAHVRAEGLAVGCVGWANVTLLITKMMSVKHPRWGLGVLSECG